MRKGPIVVAVCCAAALTISIPKLQKCYKSVESNKQVEQKIAEVSNKVTSLESDLAKVKKQCDGMEVDSNVKTAETISKFKGSSIQSITSLVTRDNELFECSEITSPEDVIYFNNEIEKIRYTLKVSNPKAFIKSLNKSAVAIESMNLDSAEKTATITVTSVSPELSSAAEQTVEGGMKE